MTSRRQRRLVAVEEDDDDARLARVERLRRGEQHRAVVIGLVLPQEPAARARMAEAAVVVDVEEGPRLAGLLIVRNEAVIGEGRVLERRRARHSRRRSAVMPACGFGPAPEGGGGAAQLASISAAPNPRPADRVR